MIIWLASYPRSGNTLLRLILRQCFGLNSFSLYDDVTDIGSNPEVAEVVGHVTHGLDPERFVEQARSEAELYMVKTHEPPLDESPAIYVVRDGRSATVSFYHYLREIASHDVSLRDVILGQTDFLGFKEFRSWSENFEAWDPLRRPNTVFLRFEDLIDLKSETFDRLAQAIGKPASTRNLPDFGKLNQIFPKFFRQGSNRSNIGELQGEDYAVFSLMHGQLMKDLGYSEELPADVPSVLSRHALIALRKQYEGKLKDVQIAKHEMEEIQQREIARLNARLIETGSEISSLHRQLGAATDLMMELTSVSGAGRALSRAVVNTAAEKGGVSGVLKLAAKRLGTRCGP